MGGGYLVLSISVNLLFILLLVFSEYRGHTFANALERRGLYHINAESRKDYWALFGWTNCLEKLNISCDAVFFGNSITRGSDFQSYFPNKKIVNLGYSGDILLHMKDRVAMIKAVNPKKIFIMGGTNDIALASPSTIVERYEMLLDSISCSMPTSKVYVQSILPINETLRKTGYTNSDIIETNKAIKIMAEKRGLTYIDLFNSYYKRGQLPNELTADGIHLYPSSYDIWYKKIKRYVDE